MDQIAVEGPVRVRLTLPGGETIDVVAARTTLTFDRHGAIRAIAADVRAGAPGRRGLLPTASGRAAGERVGVLSWDSGDVSTRDGPEDLPPSGPRHTERGRVDRPRSDVPTP